MSQNYYDTERAASEYLWLHYGDPKPWALTFPARCVAECLAVRRLAKKARALDLGCAVGGGSFELARHCEQVIGIDASRQFIDIAQRMRERGGARFQFCVEGDLTLDCRVAVPRGIKRKRVVFEVGDATQLHSDLGKFDVVMMANLIDRVPDPRKLLKQMPAQMVAPSRR
ncbi:MAG TPA: methyltransferase domain-containing protein, partial [Verrucomicrobiae bacterium]